MKKPVRYRDVLAMLKAMARDPQLSADGIRAVLAGNLGDDPAYTQADIQRTRALAAELGWELSTVIEPSDEEAAIGRPENYQEEIRRLHAALRCAREQVKALERGNEIGRKRSADKSAARHAQLAAAGVASIDEAFARLAVFTAHCVCGAAGMLAPTHAEDLATDEGMPEAQPHG